MYRVGKKFSKPTLSRLKNGDLPLENSVDQTTHDEQAPKVRLDELLQKKYPAYSRSALQDFIKSGYVSVLSPSEETSAPAAASKAVSQSAILTRPGQKIPENSILTLVLPENNKNTAPAPEIIFENAYVKVLNKPAGLLSMKKGAYCPEPTLEDYGLLVHRLDRGTSGVVILAKDEKTQSFLRRQFQDRKTHKVYLAVVSGHPRVDEANLDLPIARDLKHATKFRVEAGGKPSATYYKVLAKNEKYSLVLLKPSTGRTHQLRVHLSYLGTPIVGDPVYSKDAMKYSRLFLHAYSLEITIPENLSASVEPKEPSKTYHTQAQSQTSFRKNNTRKTFFAPLPPVFTDFLNSEHLSLPTELSSQSETVPDHSAGISSSQDQPGKN